MAVVRCRKLEDGTGMKKNKIKSNEKVDLLVFLVPSLALLAIFVLWPMIYSIAMSFYDWNPLKEKIFIGIENYIHLFKDELWWESVWNTTKYTLINVPIIVVVALLMSELVIFIEKKSKFLVKLVKSVYFLPCVLSLVATGVAWRYLLGTNYGVINGMLNSLGLHSVAWLTSTKIALATMAMVTVWRWSGYYMVIAVAGRLDIPVSYYEAADIEGAGAWHKFRFITLPLLKPVLFYIVLVCVIGTFQEFDLVYAMTAGGPSTSTYLTGYDLYRTAFSSLKMGYASAMAVFLFVFSIIITIIQFRFNKES